MSRPLAKSALLARMVSLSGAPVWLISSAMKVPLSADGRNRRQEETQEARTALAMGLQ
ncbi:hypothetical protein [Andreprevotia sp. IGB-42]|uniref:hypothetical protein n=1 Tax=Andreprevotia sp. IGB-42 TaxID=2497473 RepID=UPI001F20B07A|nr:hypothetical protein [Andreprevotia sp. IGB-42]